MRGDGLLSTDSEQDAGRPSRLYTKLCLRLRACRRDSGSDYPDGQAGAPSWDSSVAEAQSLGVRPGREVVFADSEDCCCRGGRD